ncbi:MAG: malate synthase G [Paracoccaceae bacterium]|nr:malate synthase G [Paracoccaceae bacterium]MDE2916471.1 malate synthase G [Paracoccaceae bacterium]
MSRKIHRTISIDRSFAEFIEEKALPGTGVSKETFWDGLASLIEEFDSINKELVSFRDKLQSQIDDWHLKAGNQVFDKGKYKAFLSEIGYLVDEGPDFSIQTTRIDPEIATIAGPQLVVPITNARFAINAINARWNSLYDALYGTNVLGKPAGQDFDTIHASKVIEWTKDFLDDCFPLGSDSHQNASVYHILDNTLVIQIPSGEAHLADKSQFVGYTGEPSNPDSIILRRNGIHLIMVFDRSDVIGKTDLAGIADVVLESAITTILDCEDSVAVVDVEDKILAYENWLGIMKGDLVAEFEKDGANITRIIKGNKEFITPKGDKLTLKGQALLLIRNSASHINTDIVTDLDGNQVGETILDALCTTLIGLHDLRGANGNSREGSIYIVKPKMHGPEEVALADRLFSRVEEILNLEQYTVKMGIMDEERRTTVNLKECIRAARRRVAFINTGFLDRTGDEIHTSFKMGPFLRKGSLKQEPWLPAYENWNVDVGLNCGLKGKSQIGKGMWAMPDLMKEMLEQKIEHPLAGANTAWVPSPTAATLHAVHYFKVDVRDIQDRLLDGGSRASLDTILQIPVAEETDWSEDEILQEVRNNLQGILGYVVRWVDQGIGCSKIPDINNVGLMEDRATCRISSQHVANWLHHGIVDKETVMNSMKEMAVVVDSQNKEDPNYILMAPTFDGEAFKAACDLVFKGDIQSSGYTEFILHQRRLERKRKMT